MRCNAAKQRQSVIARPCAGPWADCAGALLAWYTLNRRDLPWRAQPGKAADPYRVWLSEIMLQQTAVAAAKPYFAAFLARWPTVEDLARANASEVMRQWAGLGYYSRVRNLLACARIVVEDFGGRFPDSEAALLSLPGIGPYTAAAIAAIAFGQPAAAVDGNIERVAARLFAVETPLPAAKACIKEKTRRLVPQHRPGDFTQAMMDLGATICLPRNPSCRLCPLRKFCQAYASGIQENLPRKKIPRKRPIRFGACFFVQRKDGALLLRTRPPRGLLGGMTELPGTAWEARLDLSEAVKQAPLRADYRTLERQVAHSFSHFALRLAIFVAEVPAGRRAPAGCRFVPRRRLGREAFPSLMRKVIEAARLGGINEPVAPRAPLR